MRYPQEHVVLKGDVCEGPVHQDHLCVLNVFPYLQQQEHSPAVQVWGPRAKPVMMCPRGDLQSQGHSLKSVPRVWNSPPLFLKYSVSFHMSGIRRSKEQRERNRRQDRTGNLITGQRMPAAGVVVLLTRNADLATAGGALSGWPTVRRPVGKSQHPSLAS